MRSTDRWEIVVISDHDADIIINVIRNTLAGMAEDFGYDGRTHFDLSAFAPSGERISEYVYYGDEEEVKRMSHYRYVIEFDADVDREEAFNILCEVSDYIGESFPTENKEGWLEP